MTSNRVVEAVDVTAEGVLGLGSGLEDGAPDHLGLQGLEEGLDDRVVVTVSFPRHGDRDAVFPQHGLVLHGAILGEFKRSSQHGFYCSTAATRQAPLRAFSSPASFSAS